MLRMPQLEAGDLAEVADDAVKVAAALAPLDRRRLRRHHPDRQLRSDDEVRMAADPAGERGGAGALRRHQDICEYVVGLSKAHGLADGLSAIEGNVTLHHACHARAQNMGAKSAEMLRLIPGTKVDLVERCSGHGGHLRGDEGDLRRRREGRQAGRAAGGAEGQ
ncbi:MAG: hypothetical protein WDM85_17175 [Caulobacteraceae bacterium]